MFVSKLECPQRRGNHSLTSRCRFKNPKIHNLKNPRTALSPGVQAAFLSPLFLTDLDKKYRNEIVP